MDEQLHINFLEPVGKKPRDWGNFRMRAYWRDDSGYLRQGTYEPQDIPAEHLTAMQAVTAAIVALGEPWTATKVIARLDSAMVAPEPEAAPQDDGNTQVEPHLTEWLELEVSAAGDGGGSQIFTSCDYPALAVHDSAAVAFFKYFTHS